MKASLLRSRLAVLGAALLLHWAPLAVAAADHAGHGAGQAKPPARPELGASAIFSADGQLLAVAKLGEQVMLYRSADDGRSWAPPIAVNAQAEPISANGENRPKIAFAADGALLVAWTQPLGASHAGAVRLARSEDGQHFAPPITVHRSPASHSFESLVSTPDNRVVLAWVDKRDLAAARAAGMPYRGAAIYAAVSTDGGRSFRPEFKLADHSCECCRVAGAVDRDGSPLFMWRHVFAPNERDHALARLAPDGTAGNVQRATVDRWQVDACPHQGPSLAVDDQGGRHAVWFNQQDGEGRVHYGQLVPDGQARVDGQRPVGGPRAAHADIAAAAGKLAIAWKEFDGERTQLRALVSADGGSSFAELALAASDGASDQARVVRRQDRLFVFWRTEKEGFRVFPLP